MRRLDQYIALFFLLFFSVTAMAQNAEQAEKQGDELRLKYDFRGATDRYNTAISQSEDSLYNILLMEKITMCDNGFGMLQYATTPEVLQTATFSKDEFFLQYSHIAEGTWRKNPDGDIYYYDEQEGVLMFPKWEEKGGYNLYSSRKLSDTLWSTPAFISESFVSDKDEILPILSPDKKSLYFSSKGLFGMGGFDIFVSRWDEDLAGWGAPENLGFPYSSPYDDYLYSPTPDGNFALFASNRDCSGDSVKVYVLKYDSTPVKTAVSSIAEAQKIARLEVKKQDRGDVVEKKVEIALNPLVSKYIDIYKKLQSVKEMIVALQNRQNTIREAYTKESNKARLRQYEEQLLDFEAQLFDLQNQQSVISNDLQQAEMECIIKGVSIPNMEISQKEKSQEDVTLPTYTFKKNRLLLLPTDIVFEVPEPKIDLSFKVGKEGVLMDIVDFPKGLVYQIQIFASSRKSNVKQLKGLSPVFERRSSSGSYVYTVGAFKSYNEANSKLNSVKKEGFTSAYIVAFDNNKSITVKNARALETKRATGEKFRIVFTKYPDGIPSALLSLLRSITNKEIAKGTDDNYGSIYFVAPFDDKSQADEIADKLSAGGAEGVIVEVIK